MFTYNVTHHAACGMPIPLLTGEEELTTARDRVARRLRYLRAEGFPVWTLEAGRKWEIGEPLGCVLIPDDSGLLVFRSVKVKAPECWYCGCECDREEPNSGWSCSCQDPMEEEEESSCDCGLMTCGCDSGEEGLS